MGDKWTLLVIRDFVFMEKRRFSEFLASPEGIATNVLTDRLQRLTQAGVIESSRDADDGRKVIYKLTEQGIDLVPALVELARFGTRYDSETGAPADLVDRIENDRQAFIEELQERLREA